MSLSAKAAKIQGQLAGDAPKLGDLKKMAGEIKKDHALAEELWGTGAYYPRLLAILIMDKGLLDQAALERLAKDMLAHDYDERNQLADWLLANQLKKSKKTIALVEGWKESGELMLRRIFWDHQARLRWRSQEIPDNAVALLDTIDANMLEAEPEVQRSMNFTVAQIGIYEPAYRKRCIALGEEMGLYIDEPVPRNCTSPYIPLWIDEEVGKLKAAAG